jgi:hypothetical protein
VSKLLEAYERSVKREVHPEVLAYDTWLEDKTFDHVIAGQLALGVKADGWYGPGTNAELVRRLHEDEPTSPSTPAAKRAAWTERVRVPPMPEGYPLAPCRQSTMLELLGKPGELTENCSAANAATSRLMVTGHVHLKFRATGLRPAVETVTRVFANIAREIPDLYQLLGTAGMLCVRKVRGGTNYSNHSWGSAMDITIDGQLDALDDGYCQRGLLAIEPYFRAEGFFWGAWFSREDAQHFEASDGLVRQWRVKGLI